MQRTSQAAEQIFVDALECRQEERAAFLDAACGTSPSLRREVETLLLEHDRIGSFLGEPLFSDMATTVPTGTVAGYLAGGYRLGRYTIIAPLGAGGMGTVYQAHDEVLQRVVALKVLSQGLLSAEAKRRFHTEGLALAKLSHSNIATVYDVGEQDGVDYIVMECVPGESLATKLRNGPLSIKDATSIVQQIALALEEAHEHGIIHRDLKPANVMITPRGQAKVLDFGIAKLLEPQDGGASLTLTETHILMGTPRYMSPEQAQGRELDKRTDLWSLGVVYYEALTGRSAFRGADSLAVLRAVVDGKPEPLLSLRPDIPAGIERVVAKALRKDPAQRFPSAAAFAEATTEILTGMSGAVLHERQIARKHSLWFVATLAAVICVTAALGVWFYEHTVHVRWAREDAPAQIEHLENERKFLQAFLLWKKAHGYAPSDPTLEQAGRELTQTVAVASEPAGATVEIQDYLSPDGPRYVLGTTPLKAVTIPKGYFRWKLTRPGSPDLIAAPDTEREMTFDLAEAAAAPAGMVTVPAQYWADSISFIGWMGPYKLPRYFVDRLEVSNAEFQRFVDAGGYAKQQYWTEPFTRDGHPLSWSDAVASFRDTTGRPGPSTWVGGHYPEGQGDLPVTGVSWFEASAYAAYAGKQLPVAAQWFEIAPPDNTQYVVQESNIATASVARVGAYPGLGPYGTYDAAGNAREWTANTVDNDLRFILGGSWRSPTYLYLSPEALSPFDRSDTNGFRCVRNTAALPAEVVAPVNRAQRDFAHFHTVSDEVFHAYSLLYEYPDTPLDATEDGVVQETKDWTERKVTYNAGYNGERMSAYLFLPKNVKPPYQTVLFFPSARVLFLPDSHNSHVLGDVKFFDYIIQSGRAVLYPVYDGTYERRLHESYPGASESMTLTTHHYKDAARSLDYLRTRPDIDSSRLAYLGVSMGAAEGILYSSLLQDRLKTAILLDGGFFLDKPQPGGDAADFAVRMKKPVLMVNGRYDFTFPLDRSQNPLFAMLGTPAAEKRHVVLETPHDVTEQRPVMVREVLHWLDQYLGPVPN